MPPSSAQPGFTIVTPVLNGARYLDAAISSVRAQTYSSWEHLIVDGGSTDHSCEIVRHHAEQDPRIRLIEGRDRGMYDAILRGFARGRKEICYWLNSDDLMMPWAMDVVADHMRRHEADWVTGYQSFWDPSGRLWSVQPTGWYPSSLVKRGWFNSRALGWIQQESTFFTRAILDKVPVDRLELIRTRRLAGDFILWTELALHAELTVVPTVVAGFRMHPRNASVDAEGYLREIRDAGFWIPPRWLGWVMGVGYSVLANRRASELRSKRLLELRQRVAREGR